MVDINGVDVYKISEENVDLAKFVCHQLNTNCLPRSVWRQIGTGYNPLASGK